MHKKKRKQYTADWKHESREARCGGQEKTVQQLAAEYEKAIVADSHSVLVAIYRVLNIKQPYAELGAAYFDKLDTTRIQQHHIRRLEQPGFTVMLTPGRLLRKFS